MEEVCYTLVFVKNEDKILLGYKKRGLGSNKWNGYGGKIEHNEDIYSCATRELLEESSLQVDRKDLNYLGTVTYVNISAYAEKRKVYIFNSIKVTGEPKETEEMKPKWFNINNIPYEKMWPDLKFWLHLVINDKWLQAQFIYQSNDQIIDFNVVELSEAPLYKINGIK